MLNHHMKCWIWKKLWALSALAMIVGWVAAIQNSPILGLQGIYWFMTALVLGVLAIPIKLDCTQCGTCYQK
jgi:hypothetical protein